MIAANGLVRNGDGALRTLPALQAPPRPRSLTGDWPPTARSNAVCPRLDTSRETGRRLFVSDRQHHSGEVLVAPPSMDMGKKQVLPICRTALYLRVAGH